MCCSARQATERIFGKSICSIHKKVEVVLKYKRSIFGAVACNFRGDILNCEKKFMPLGPQQINKEIRRSIKLVE